MNHQIFLPKKFFTRMKQCGFSKTKKAAATTRLIDDTNQFNQKQRKFIQLELHSQILAATNRNRVKIFPIILGKFYLPHSMHHQHERPSPAESFTAIKSASNRTSKTLKKYCLFNASLCSALSQPFAKPSASRLLTQTKHHVIKRLFNH